MDDKKNIDLILQADNLPALPTVAITAMKMADDGKSSLSDIAYLVQKEPVLSAQLVKTANSAFYGSRSAVSTVNQALSRVGLRASIPLITTLSLKGLVQSSKTILNLEHFWRRSVLASGVSAWLSGFVGAKREEALLAGLVQDIGLLAASTVYPEQYNFSETVWQDHQAVSQFEIEIFACDHAHFSASLLKQWGFPYSIVEAAALSHGHPVDEMNPLTWCVAGANELTHVIVRGLESGQLINELQASLAFHWLQHHNRKNIDETVIECLQFISGTEQLFDIAILPDEMEAVIAEYEDRKAS